MHDIAEYLVASGLASSGSLQGCTSEELVHLEEQLGVMLPQRYREFLAIAGRNAGKFLLGTDISFPKILGFRSVADGLVRTAGARWKLGQNAVVFAIHQGYQFLYFEALGADPDPPVYHSLEGNQPTCIAPSFSKWLAECIADESSSCDAV